MMNPLAVSAGIFICIFGAVLLGVRLHRILPEHHLGADSKDVVKLSTGLVATVTALLLAFLLASCGQCATSPRGAAVPWITYEAEQMRHTGTQRGPGFAPNTLEAESSGRAGVMLTSTGQYVELTALKPANALVVRYSMPDTATGGGFDATLRVYTNGIFARKLPVTSKFSWQYGAFPWTQHPADGAPRNFYDEARIKGLTIHAQDTLRIQKDAGDTATWYVIDLIDLEQIAPPLTRPPGNAGDWLNVTDAPFGAIGNGLADDTEALRQCTGHAMALGKKVWVPAGTYKITGTIDGLRNLTVQGAGMWHTTFVADPAFAADTPARRLSFYAYGHNVHLADFAMIGYRISRNNNQPNDGIGGEYGTNSSLTRLWIEHSSAGMWLANSCGLRITDCRVRNTTADGYNLCVGVRGAIVSNCTARGNGDDCFATWPTTYIGQVYKPGFNLFTHCTGQLPFLANGGAIYGGEGNVIDHCLFQDIPYAGGVLLSDMFEVGSNVFSGTTIVQNCDLIRTGGDFRHPALKFSVERHAMTNVVVKNLRILDSVSHAVGIDRDQLLGATMSGLCVSNWGMGVPGCYSVWANYDTTGAVSVSDSRLGDFGNYSAGLALQFNNVASSLPAAWLAGDLGNSIRQGSTAFSTGTFVIAGAGANIGGSADAFRYVCVPATGDCSIVARVAAQQATDPCAKAGVMMRADLRVNAPNAAVVVTPRTGALFQWRSLAGDDTRFTIAPDVRTPCWLKLQRRGNTFAGYYSTNGSAWTQIGATATVAMPPHITRGLAVTAFNHALCATVTINAVTCE
jgi:hypothetical protein